MGLDYPLFLINYKVYEGTAGEAGLDYAQTVERVARETGTTFAVMPQAPDLRLVADETDLPVVAQTVDAGGPGRGNGKVLPGTVAEAGADAVVLNHPESRAALSDMVPLLEECRNHDLESIVCADDLETGRAVATLEPDCLLFEKPDDIGTDRAITRTHPDRVREFLDTIDEVNPDTRVLVGGGISVPEDVARGFELGADAAGAASAAVGADDREAWLRGVADAMP